MEKIREFLKINLNVIMIIMMIIIMFNTCSIKTENAKIRKLIENINTKEESQIEGLKNEMRFIQATDRTLLDVRYQTELGDKIKDLENSKK